MNLPCLRVNQVYSKSFTPVILNTQFPLIYRYTIPKLSIEIDLPQLVDNDLFSKSELTRIQNLALIDSFTSLCSLTFN